MKNKRKIISFFPLIEEKSIVEIKILLLSSFHFVIKKIQTNELFRFVFSLLKLFYYKHH